jgi:hypothetical protein
MARVYDERGRQLRRPFRASVFTSAAMTTAPPSVVMAVTAPMAPPMTMAALYKDG